MKVAYWKDKNNFGDILTPVLLNRLFGLRVEWSEPDRADLIGIGSVLDNISPEYSGIIWGSGRMFGEKKTYLPNALVLALRGRQTQRWVDCNKPIALGDPGLLCKMIAPEFFVKRHRLGIINHWNDDGEYFKGHHIDITAGVDEVIGEAIRCDRIVSSSLHGIILADALSIPRMWFPCAMNPGGAFKFEDYQSVLGGKIKPYEWYTSDPKKIDEINQRLFNALNEAL